MDKCNLHSRAITLSLSPIKLTAGGADTPVPLGSNILALATANRRKPVVTGLYTPRIVRIDWPDMGVPALDSDDWRYIAERIKGMGRPVHVHCQMGHGRTGTALALLSALWGLCEGDPVLWVRERYCAQAVESQKQIDYLKTITGRRIDSGPSNPVIQANWTDTPYQPFDSPYLPDTRRREEIKHKYWPTKGPVLDDGRKHYSADDYKNRYNPHQ